MHKLDDINTVPALADYLKVSAQTVYRWVAEGRLKGFKTHPGRSGRVLVRREAVEALLAELEAESAARLVPQK